MEESTLWSLFNSLFPIIFIWIIIYSVVSNIRKKNKIIKLKSWEIQSREIKWVVSEIKYTSGWKNNSWKITSRYFVAKSTNPITNEEMEFESDYFPYKDSWLKIRWMWPTQEDKNKLLEHARTFVKEWDTVKIHVSNENSALYYIDDVVKNNEKIEDDVIQIENSLNLISKNLNISWFKGNEWFTNILKKARIFDIVIVLLFVWLPIFVSRINDNNWINFNMPKINWWINLNFGWSYIVRIILVLLIAFIIYKVIVGYKGIKK
jgi:hypothetical protein